MQQLLLNINNPEVEDILRNLSLQHNKPVEKIALDLLNQVVLKQNADTNKLKYSVLNADEYITKIDYDIEELPDIENIKPFDNIKDSAEYVKSIRNKKLNANS